jgi:predicted acetyltransferase
MRACSLARMSRRRGITRKTSAPPAPQARALGLTRLVATVVPDNDASIRLLEKPGLRFERTIQAPDTVRDLQLFAMRLD